ncbi:MAG: nuclear transport factor 2 family protein [Solirubrobacteraceae bacterium]
MPENVEIVRAGFEHFISTGDLQDDIMTPDFVWDMSQFEGWPEESIYPGPEGTRAFLRAWTEPWEDWQLQLESMHGAGDRVVAVVRQSGRSAVGGMTVEMNFAMVWTLRDGKQARMVMYSDPAEAFAAVGLDYPA